VHIILISAFGFGVHSTQPFFMLMYKSAYREHETAMLVRKPEAELAPGAAAVKNDKNGLFREV
jgi:hypothetical protein